MNSNMFKTISTIRQKSIGYKIEIVAIIILGVRELY